MDFVKKDIDEGITLISVNANQFKTNEIAVSLAVPLRAETASANALLINLLSRKSAEYPTLLSLNKKLAGLYGAVLAPTVSKIGECQVLKLGVTCLDDRFSLDGESISAECVKLLMSLLFEPKLDENGDFFSEDIESEKRILTEKLEAEENEKRTYVLRQTEKLMFKDEPYSINRYGNREDIKALDTASVKASYNNLLSQAKVMVTIIGSADADAVSECVKHAFKNVNREYSPLPQAVFVPVSNEVQEHMERIDVKQGKLVLGFRVNLRPNDSLTPAMRSFCDVFGGGPYSKLFANVREKLSLCYYCSARYTRLKSMILVQCGCNEENMDKAVNEILNQLKAIQQGDFEEEFNSSKVSITDMILSVNDAPEALENWYSNQITDDVIKSPEMSAAENNGVTAQQIQSCAELLSLDTVYKLSSPKEAE